MIQYVFFFVYNCLLSLLLFLGNLSQLDIFPFANYISTSKKIVRLALSKSLNTCMRLLKVKRPFLLFFCVQDPKYSADLTRHRAALHPPSSPGPPPRPAQEQWNRTSCLRGPLRHLLSW